MQRRASYGYEEEKEEKIYDQKEDGKKESH